MENLRRFGVPWAHAFVEQSCGNEQGGWAAWMCRDISSPSLHPLCMDGVSRTCLPSSMSPGCNESASAPISHIRLLDVGGQSLVPHIGTESQTCTVGKIEQTPSQRA